MILKYFISVSFAAALITPSSAQRTIVSSEDLRFQAQVTRDTAALRFLLANDLVYIHSNALVETKSDFLKSVGTGSIAYQSLQLEPGRTIREYGKTGISNGIIAVQGLLNNNAFNLRLRYTAVYVRRKGIWQLASWQSTRIN